MSDDQYGGDPWSRARDPHEQWREPDRPNDGAGWDEPPIWQPEPMPGVWPSGPDSAPGRWDEPYGGYPPPAAPPPPPPSPPRSNRNTLVMIWTAVGVVVLVAVAVSVFLIVRSARSDDSHRAAGGSDSAAASSSDAASPTSSAASSSAASSSAVSSSAASSASNSAGTADGADADTAARALDTLIDASAAARSGVQPALNHISACAGDDNDVTALQKAADTRRALIGRLDAVDLDALPNGDTLKSSFATVLSTSAAADDEYVRWADDQQGCSGRADTTRAKRDGDADSRRATAAKHTFLRQWNPIAHSRGLATRKQGDI